jgi:hypothetical protein
MEIESQTLGVLGFEVEHNLQGEISLHHPDRQYLGCSTHSSDRCIINYAAK